MEYTKGPWIVDYRGTLGHIKAVSPELAPNTPTVCRYDGEHRASTIGEEEAQANAHLIAAAPDLYEALKEMTQWVSHDKVWKALAKAEEKEET